MEARSVFDLFWKRRMVFLLVAIGVPLVAIFIGLFQPERTRADVVLHVTRSGSETAGEYQYDSYYRLQADERFADTVVRWLEAPGIAQEVHIRAQDASGVENIMTGDPSGYFSARRVSSQVLSVRYVAQTPDAARAVAPALVETINSRAELLNKDQELESWFVVVSEDPYLSDSRVSITFIAVVGVLLGLFCALWAVLIAWYVGSKKENE